MSVLIKMEMPKNCHNCELSIRTEVTYGTVYVCQILNEVIGNVMVRQIHCPLVEVPTPHGRLIDADALLTDKSMSIIGKGMIFGGQYVFSESEIVNAPTIIPADDKDINVPNKEDGE